MLSLDEHQLIIDFLEKIKVMCFIMINRWSVIDTRISTEVLWNSFRFFLFQLLIFHNLNYVLDSMTSSPIVALNHPMHTVLYYRSYHIYRGLAKTHNPHRPRVLSPLH